MNIKEIISKIRTRFADLAPQNRSSDSGQACIMELVSWAAGEPWSAFPNCVPREVARLCQQIHDNATTAEYATIWTDDRMRAVLGAERGEGATRRRAYIAAEHARATAVRVLRARRIDTSEIDALPAISNRASARALRDALRKHADAYAAAAAANAAAYADANADAADAARQRARIEILDLWCAKGGDRG